jgi:hypothetical protein
MNATVEACSQKIFRVDLKMPSILAADRQNPPAGVVFHDQIADSFAKRLKMIGAPELDALSARRLPGPPVDHERRAISRPRAEQFREAAPASFDQEHRTKTPRAESIRPRRQSQLSLKFTLRRDRGGSSGNDGRSNT